MYCARLTSDSYQSVRATLTADYRQVQIEGVSDSVAVGFVREYGTGSGPLPAGYIVFQGKQGKASHHFSAKDIAQAEQRVDEALRAAQWAANRKVENRQKAKNAETDYTEHTDHHVLIRSYSLTATAKLIRAALKCAFPTVKFSVTTERCSKTSSVDIAYVDGPSSQQVKDIYAPFITGHFDGMQDIHVFNDMPTAVAEGGELVRLSYGAKYINDRRSYSEAYGHCLNSLDLRKVPSLSDQFSAFHSWHTAREYNLKTYYTESAGRISLSSNSRSSDLEKLAAMLMAQGHASELTQAGDMQTLTVADPNRPATYESALTDDITTEAKAAQVAARIETIWALAEERWQQGGRPLRFIECSYFVVDSRQMEDRSAYLNEEATEVHQLTIQHSLYANDPHRTHERVLNRLARLTAERTTVAEPDEVAAEYEAAERHWLDQDTATDYESAERRWLNDLGEYPPALLPWQLN